MRLLFLIFMLLFGADFVRAAERSTNAPPFPRALDSYGDAQLPLGAQLKNRVQLEPLNVAATVIFLLAIFHTFAAPKIMRLAHHWREEHQKKIQAQGRTAKAKGRKGAVDDVSFKAEVAHFLGEIEAVFGIWVLPLILAVIAFKDWPTAEHYLSGTVIYTEPMFVVVIMTIAASRPVLRAAEQLMQSVARLGGGTPAASWFSILTVGPLLGSFITEPAAMTICALLLARSFYDCRPPRGLAYATLGLLFVNVSIGGTLTHFAAPPVLMVAAKWGWGMSHMLGHFGWKAAAAVVVSNIIYYLVFKKSFASLAASGQDATAMERWEERTDSIPAWITGAHLLFLGWTVFTAHYPALFIGGFLFFLAFIAATEHHQNPVILRPALLVGFFLAGLVVHGGLQSWWIAPLLSSLGDRALFFGSVVLTAFNDNAAITFLASLVPTLSPEAKYMVLAGAVTGGGLTVIANAPNPAGQAILSKYFPDGLSPVSLLLGALLPTAIAALFFLLLR